MWCQTTSVGGQISARSVCALSTLCSHLWESPAFWVEASLWSPPATRWRTPAQSVPPSHHSFPSSSVTKMLLCSLFCLLQKSDATWVRPFQIKTLSTLQSLVSVPYTLPCLLGLIVPPFNLFPAKHTHTHTHTYTHTHKLSQIPAKEKNRCNKYQLPNVMIRLIIIQITYVATDWIFISVINRASNKTQDTCF